MALQQFRRVLATAFIAIFSLSQVACVDGKVLGLERAEWFRRLSVGETLPIFSVAYVDYDELTELGPGALLFLSWHAEAAGEARLRQRLLEAATRLESGLYRQRAGQLLEELYLATNQFTALSDLYAANPMKLPDWQLALGQAKALQGQANWPAAIVAWQDFTDRWPEQAATRSASLLTARVDCLLGMVADNLTDASWRLRLTEAARQLTEQRAETSLAAALTRLLPILEPLLPADLSLLLALREAAGRRDYGPALRLFYRYIAVRNHASQFDQAATAGSAAEPATGTPGDNAAPATETRPEALAVSDLFATVHRLDQTMLADFVRSLPFATAADLARCWLFSEAAEGLNVFRLLVAQPELPLELAYLYHFYAGRLESRQQRPDQAALYLRQAARLAGNGPDRDVAYWYLAEGQLATRPAETIASLAEALAVSDNPGYYDDLLEALSRLAVLRRDGHLLASLDAAAGRRAAPSQRARLDYLLARAAAAGLISLSDLQAAFGENAPASLQRYQNAHYQLAANQAANPWYRLLANLRLGRPALVRPPETAAAVAPPAATPSAGSGRDGSAPASQPVADQPYAEFCRGLVDWQLGSRLFDETSRFLPVMYLEEIRLAAQWLADGGRHAESIRLANRLLARSDTAATMQDWRLAWPQPFGDAMATALAVSSVDRSLMYGLIRSESLFMPAVVSMAGAVGLSQLMPATAAEMAGRLRLASWDSANPADNLLIGTAYLKRLLDNNGGAVLPALFSYNAGPGRYRAWRTAAAGLPVDLMLETLDYAETRQYGRNVATAAVYYETLYGSVDANDYLSWLLGEAD